MNNSRKPESISQSVNIPCGQLSVRGDLELPAQARGVVLFAHGGGSSRLSSRNRRVAAALRGAGLATLLLDLLTKAEEAADAETGRFRAHLGLLAARVAVATDWLAWHPATRSLPLGYFGAGTGAAAALVAAAERPHRVEAIVSRGGRPDQAGDALGLVQAPTLLIVGEQDPEVLELNRRALLGLESEKELVVVPGAGHHFEEPGALETVVELAIAWFTRYLR